MCLPVESSTQCGHVGKPFLKTRSGQLTSNWISLLKCQPAWYSENVHKSLSETNSRALTFRVVGSCAPRPVGGRLSRSGGDESGAHSRRRPRIRGQRVSAVQGARVRFRAVLPTGTGDLDQDHHVTGAADTSSWRSTGGHDLGRVAVPYADDKAPTLRGQTKGAEEGQGAPGARSQGLHQGRSGRALGTPGTYSNARHKSNRAETPDARTEPCRSWRSAHRGSSGEYGWSCPEPRHYRRVDPARHADSFLPASNLPASNLGAGLSGRALTTGVRRIPIGRARTRDRRS